LSILGTDNVLQSSSGIGDLNNNYSIECRFVALHCYEAIMSRPEHLGDGAYVQHEPHTGMVVLTTGRHLPTEEHPGNEPDNKVYLEDFVLVELLKWLSQNDPLTQRFLATVAEGNSLNEAS